MIQRLSGCKPEFNLTKQAFQEAYRWSEVSVLYSTTEQSVKRLTFI